MKDFRVNDKATFGSKKVVFMRSNMPRQHDWEIVKQSQGFILGKCEDEWCVMTVESYYNPNPSFPWVRRYKSKDDALVDFAWVTHVDMALFCNGM